MSRQPVICHCAKVMFAMSLTKAIDDLDEVGVPQAINICRTVRQDSIKLGANSAPIVNAESW